MLCTWNIKSRITCDSKNVIYFLSCNMCNGNMNYIGQTTNLRQRMNNHISESRSGISTCNFPTNVFNCGKTNKNLKEPFFKIYVFFKLSDSNLLTDYENRLFQQGQWRLARKTFGGAAFEKLGGGWGSPQKNCIDHALQTLGKHWRRPFSSNF